MAVLLVLALTGPAEANQTSRPFRASLEGFANPVPTDPCTIVNIESGTGRALHAGRIALRHGGDRRPVCRPDGAAVKGALVLTAADGDQVFGIYETVATLGFSTNQVTAFGSLLRPSKSPAAWPAGSPTGERCGQLP